MAVHGTVMSADEQILEAIFNPENPVGGLDVRKICFVMFVVW